MITRKEKEEITKGLTETLKSAKVAVFVKFNKLTNKDAIMLRRALRAEGAHYKVARKTLIARAVNAIYPDAKEMELPGEIALATSEDLLAAPRAVYEFAKTHKEQVEIVGGFFDGVEKSQAEMLSIATIPPRQTLIGMFVNLINSPIQRLAIVTSEIAKSKA